MILQALTAYYEALAAKGELPRPGWAVVKVAYALEINENGRLLGVHSLKRQSPDGKKLLPREMWCPERDRNSSDTTSCFLCDDKRYVLGFPESDAAGHQKKAAEAFRVTQCKYNEILGGTDVGEAAAILRFFETWETQKENWREYFSEVDAKDNLVFLVGSRYAQDVEEIEAAWDRYHWKALETTKAKCMVSGAVDDVCRVHPGFNIPGGTNPKLVSFDEESISFSSYGRDGQQGLNVPIGNKTASKYGLALKYLLANPACNCSIADMKIVFWAETADVQYQDVFSAMYSQDSSIISQAELTGIMNALAEGKPIDFKEIPLNPENHFYILGLFAATKGRIGVRFFTRDTFGHIMKHTREHFERLKIVRPASERFETLPLWALLRETVNENSRDKSPSPQMAGDMLRAILTGGRYPSTLYQQTQLRIRAEREVTWGRAAIIKAYLLRNTDNEKYKEALTVELNEKTGYQPYVLGRMFSVLEAIQLKANPGINTTIRDKYFSSACATPAMVFPTLINLADKHLRKMDEGSRVYFSKQLGGLMAMITESFPAHHDLNDQGIFQLGYYHQTQKRYEKKTAGTN